MPIEFGPLYSRVGIILIPIIIGIYSWQAGNIHLALIVSLYPHILLFVFDFFTLKVLIWIWIYIGICLSLIATGMVLVVVSPFYRPRREDVTEYAAQIL